MAVEICQKFVDSVFVPKRGKLVGVHKIIQWCTSYKSEGGGGATSGSTSSLPIDLRVVVVLWIATLVIVSWILWKDRCDAVHQGIKPKLRSSVSKINYYIAMCDFSNSSNDNVQEHGRSFHPSHWTLPPFGFFKINLDASFDKDTNQLGTGLVLRADSGCCKGIRGTFADGTMSPEEGECMAVREALTWAKLEGIQQLIVEADAKVVINAINDDSPPSHWDYRNIIKEIRHLATSFLSLSFVYASRDNNQTVDAIAKFVREHKIMLNMRDNFPAFVTKYLDRDLPSIHNP